LATHNQNIAASSLFSVTDADHDSIAKYEFWDSTTIAASGHWSVGGVAQGTNQNIDITAASGEHDISWRDSSRRSMGPRL
jgi:hypothetical protein